MEELQRTAKAYTFFYIVTSARPLCDGCGHLVLGIVFTCVKCFDDADESGAFNLRTGCFSRGNYVHSHEHFLDNLVLLHAKRRELKEERNKFRQPATDAHASTSREIVPADLGSAIVSGFCLAAIEATGRLATRFCTIM